MRNQNRILKLIIVLLLFFGSTSLLTQNLLNKNKNNNEDNLFSVKQNGSQYNNAVPVEGITLPEGFEIFYYAGDITNARSMTLSDSGIVYVGSRSAGKVYALVDRNGDNKSDENFIVAEGLNNPNGVAYKEGSLFVAEINRILKFEDIDNSYMNKPDYSVIKNDYPIDTAHGWKYISFGPDGNLYIPVGAPCNICKMEDPVYSSITSINSSGEDFSIIASGIRNTVGFDWHPVTKELWFTDNGRDMLGDDAPPDELNRISERGQYFGFPYCHGKDINDPEYGKNTDCDQFIKPEIELGPHVAALGISFYTGEMFPEEYKNKVFIAEHGSWNRSTPIGYRISTVDINENGEKADNYSTFASGWLNDTGKAWGRPVDVLQMVDGSILVSDDTAGAIYRIVYTN
jgi:glucose/arabinose dehydrogenase